MEYFVKIPTEYINCNLKDDLGVHSCFYVVYFMLADQKNRYDQTVFAIKDVFNMYHAKCTPKKPKLFKCITDTLEYMAKIGLIEIDQDLSNVRYKTAIRVQLTPKFEDYNHFTIFTKSELDTILSLDAKNEKDYLIHTFLYIKSHIFKRNASRFSIESYPEAFFKGINSSAKEIGIHKNTFYSCVQSLSSGSNPLLRTKRVPTSKSEGHVYPLPKVIVLNSAGWEEELEAAIKILQKICE